MKRDNTELQHNPHQATVIHCIGIGGIGVSALARMFIEQGKTVTGSDVAHSDVTKNLAAIGVSLTIGKHHSTQLPKATEVVMYSPAVPEDNPERVAARKRGILEVSYPEMLGHVMKEKTGIAISGTHGKTTTTALLGHVWTQANMDPTVIVGSFVKDFNGKNERLGSSEYVVVEADEYKASFLNYKPKAIIITSIDLDHLDYYRDLKHIQAVFEEFVLRLPAQGLLVANEDDPNIRELLKRDFPFEVMTYGIERGSLRASSITQSPAGTEFIISQGDAAYDKVFIPLTGLHNVQNALGVYALSRRFGVPSESIIHALKSFQGTWRRADIVQKIGNTVIMDDYAHHPTEIKALVRSLRQMFAGKKIHLVYQPHQEDRFTKLFDLFVDAFDGVDKITLAEIYQVAGRRGTSDSSERLAKALADRGLTVSFAKMFQTLEKRIAKDAFDFDCIAFVGAGDIIELRKQVVQRLTS